MSNRLPLDCFPTLLGSLSGSLEDPFLVSKEDVIACHCVICWRWPICDRQQSMADAMFHGVFYSWRIVCCLQQARVNWLSQDRPLRVIWRSLSSCVKVQTAQSWCSLLVPYHWRVDPCKEARLNFVFPRSLFLDTLKGPQKACPNLGLLLYYVIFVSSNFYPSNISTMRKCWFEPLPPFWDPNEPLKAFLSALSHLIVLLGW